MATTFDTDIATKPPVVSGAQPKSRVSDPRAAREMIESTDRESFYARREAYRQVQDEYDRLPPDDETDLAADGMANSTNVNWGSMAARVDETVEPLWNLAAGGDVTLRFISSIRGNGNVAQQFKYLAECHQEMIDAWDDFDEEVQKLVFHRVLFGLGVAYFDKPYGWHFSALHPANLIYVPGSPANINKHSWVAISTRFDVPDLLHVLEKPEAAAKAGWNVSALKRAIEKYGANEGQQMVASYGAGEYEEKYKPYDLYFAHRHNPTIRGHIFLVREWDGSITEHLLVADDEVGYIFSRPGKYSQFSDALVLFPHSLGDGIMDKVRGYGVKTLPFHDALNRIQNHEIDVGLLASSFLVQATDMTSLDRLQEIQLGALSVLPPGLEALQQGFSDPGVGLRAIKQDMREQLSSVNSAFGGKMDIGQQQKTARESVIKYQDASQQQGFQIDRFKGQLNRLGQTMWNRTLEVMTTSKAGPGDEAAKKMLRKAENLGFDRQLLGTIERVEWNSSSGDGNRVSTVMGLDQIRSLFPIMHADGQRQFAKRYTEAITNDRNLSDVFFGDVEKQQIGGPIETTQISRAQMENGLLEASTTAVIVRSDDDHFIHLATHLEFMQQKQQLIDAGQADPQSTLQLATRMLEHVGPHVQNAAAAIASTPEGEVRDTLKGQLAQLMEGFSQVENMRREVEENLKQQAEAEQAQQQRTIDDAMQQAQQPGPLEQRKIVERDAELIQRQQKHEQEMQQNAERHQMELSMKDLAGRTPGA